MRWCVVPSLTFSSLVEIRLWGLSLPTPMHLASATGRGSFHRLLVEDLISPGVNHPKVKHALKPGS